MTLLICKLFSNANERMCSSLKSVKIATSAVGVRRRTRLISYPDFPRPSERETSLFLMETCIQFVNNYFDWRLLGLKSITP